MASSALLMAHCMTMQQEVELSDRRLPPASCLPDGWIRSSAIYAGTVHPFFPLLISPTRPVPCGLYHAWPRPLAFVQFGPCLYPTRKHKKKHHIKYFNTCMKY